MKELRLRREDWYVDMTTNERYKDDNSSLWVQDKLRDAGFDMEKDIDYVDIDLCVTYTQKEEGDVNIWDDVHEALDKMIAL